jgi:ABC-type sugar transport system ATPase subunit
MTATPVLSVRHATKRYGGVTAVDDVSLELAKGEVLAVLGDNGAGKSTLIKCISGAATLDDGEVLLDGQPVAIRNPQEAREHGIETVYQDLSLFDNLNVVANFFAAREMRSPARPASLGWLRNRRMAAIARDTLATLEINLPNPNAPVGLLSGGQRQAVAVARAVYFASRVVILDEPTAALGMRETRNVQRLIKRLPEQGMSAILISHNLEQVMAVADRAIVLRRGQKVGEAAPDASNHDRIVSMIVGAQTMAA